MHAKAESSDAVWFITGFQFFLCFFFLTTGAKFIACNLCYQ